MHVDQIPDNTKYGIEAMPEIPALAFCLYCNLGEERSLAEVARILHRATYTIRGYAAIYEWERQLLINELRDMIDDMIRRSQMKRHVSIHTEVRVVDENAPENE
ncbi:hypothetical protein ES707_08436 [subsurface metagenome]